MITVLNSFKGLWLNGDDRTAGLDYAVQADNVYVEEGSYKSVPALRFTNYGSNFKIQQHPSFGHTSVGNDNINYVTYPLWG